jgi:uncharacterized protein (TIGR02246 family)
MTYDELKQLVLDFTEAFNRDDLDGVMRYFADDAVYDEFDGRRHQGTAAIRAAFEPQFRGDFGEIRFLADDLFVDTATGKALIAWRCQLTSGERKGYWRGLDILHVKDGRIVVKQTYAKAAKPTMTKVA